MVQWFTPVDSPVLEPSAPTSMRFVRKNERREIRRSVQLACQIVRERDFKLVAERTLDVSPDGMRIASEIDLEPGDGLIVSFQATGLGIWFDTDATVARIIRGRRPGDRGPGAAIAFSGLDRVKRLILRGYLKKAPPPIPRRPPRIDWASTVRSVA